VRGKRPEDVEAALKAELEKLAKEPVAERELQKVKNQELADSFRRLQSNFFLMLQLLFYDSFGDWRFINESSPRLQAVTAADIQRVAADTFTRDNSNVLIYDPQGGHRTRGSRLAAFSPQVRGMVRQQLAEIEQVTDRSELEEMITQLRAMSDKVPPQMKPAIQFLIERAEHHLDSLPATPPAGGEAQKPSPGARPGA
jgi:hypothetical protein